MGLSTIRNFEILYRFTSLHFFYALSSTLFYELLEKNQICEA